VELYLHSTIRIYGVVLNYVSTGRLVEPKVGLDDREKNLALKGTQTLTPWPSSPWPIAIPSALPRRPEKFKTILICFQILALSSIFRGFITCDEYAPLQSKVTIFFFAIGVGWDGVHLARRPLFGLLYQPRMIDYECGALGAMRIGSGNTSTRENLPQYHSVHHKSHMTWPGLKPRHRDNFTFRASLTECHFRVA
jgi:hypothetical protein